MVKDVRLPMEICAVPFAEYPLRITAKGTLIMGITEAG